MNRTVDGSASSTTSRRNLVADSSVRTKILAAVIVAVVVAVVVGIIGLRALSEAAQSEEDLHSGNMVRVQAIGEINAVLNAAQAHLTSQLVSDDADEKAENVEQFKADQQTFGEALATFRNGRPPGDPAVIADLESQWQSLVEVAETSLIPAGTRNDPKTWESTRDAQLTPVIAKAGQDVDALIAADNADAAKDAASIRSSYQNNRSRSIVLLIAGAAIALALGLLVARRIVADLTRIKAVCQALADGDLTRTSGLRTGDEPGLMGRALDTAIGRMRRTVSSIDQSATSLAGAAEQMSGVANRISASAEKTSSQAQAATGGADEVSRSVETVSAGSEEMGASIREISQNASEAAKVATEAVTVTSATSTTMAKLGESSAEIGNVVKVITSIAEQTNLLALNATIEAARAGDAGKGFAVVASEVKDLAQETARATEDISRRVEAIQSDTNGAVTAIDEITRVIRRISEYQTTIASAVEEQTATTSEMNRSVSGAATGTTDIARNISSLAETAEVTTQGAIESREAATTLTRMADQLKDAVAGFRY
jgi:methyl-accepting chemotaxis protein